MAQKAKPLPVKEKKKHIHSKPNVKGKIKEDNSLRYWIFATGLLTLIAFWPSFSNDFTNWDDSGYVLENLLIRKINWPSVKAIFSTYVQGNYHPLTILTYALEYHFKELSPGMYHFVCTSLHTANAMLLCYLIFKVTGKPLIAGVTAILFGIHPMHVESVAWISELKDVQYTFFYFLSLIFYVSYCTSDKSKPRNYITSLLLFTCSLFSKGQAVSLPLVMLLLDFYLDRERNKKLLLEKVPFLALSITFGIIAIFAQKASAAIQDNQLFSFFERIMFASYGLLMYLVKLIVPLKLSCFYPYPFREQGLLPYYFYICPVIVLALGFLVYKTMRYTKVIVFGSLFFLVTIALVLQLLAVGSTIMADRYSYIPYAGLFFIIAYGFDHVLKHKKNYTVMATGALSLYSLSMLFVTRSQCLVWKNSLNLWNNVIEKYPLVPVAYNNKGLYYKGENNYGEALKCYTKAVEVDPSYQGTYENRGNIFFLTGKYDEAISDFNKALKMKPNSEVAFNSRGAVYFNEGKYDLALQDFNRAIKAKPDYPEAYRNRGNAYSVKQEWEKAIADYKVYLTYDQKLEMIYFWKGLAELNLKRYQEAIDDITEALKHKQQGDFYLQRSIAYRNIGNMPQAYADAQSARSMGYKVDDAYLNSLQR